ncbi:M15 family metallopeptidase [Prosthecobacter sp.]|uniref:M15 family metallopeptidase n=1 Tax=Prosthecobacter sp. TaxID=1965333 RepID=UPI0037842FB9
MPNPTINNTPTDSRSEKNIKTLLPQVQMLARSLVHAAADLGITIKVISGYRTYAQQDALFMQGREPLSVVNKARKAAGMDEISAADNKKKVTPCKGGESNHNFQLAFDVGVFKGTSYLDESPAYAAAAVLGKQLGLTWGGDFHSNVDKPHYELRPHWAVGMSESSMLAELRKRVAAKKDLFA